MRKAYPKKKNILISIILNKHFKQDYYLKWNIILKNNLKFWNHSEEEINVIVLDIKPWGKLIP